MCVGINFSKALCQSERPFARRQRLNLRRPHLNKVSLRFADRWNIGIPACAPSGFPRCSAPVLSHQRSKTPLGAQTWKSVFRREGQQFGVMSSRLDWFPRNGFAADARNQNGAAPPNAARPGEFAGQNSEAKWNYDNCGSRQNNHHQPDQYNAEANRADEKSAQARPRFDPKRATHF